MKVMERVGEQTNTINKVEGYSLKFIHSNWNSNSSSTLQEKLEIMTLSKRQERQKMTIS